MEDPRTWARPLLSAALLSLAFLTDWVVPGLVAVVPVALWLEDHARAPARSRIRTAARFGVVAWLVILHWMYSMLDYSKLAVGAYLALTLGFGVAYGLQLAIAAWLRRWTGWRWAWILPIVWLPFDWIRTFGDLRMNADHLGNILCRVPFLAQFADVLGPYGLTAVVLVVNGSVVDLARSRGRNRAVTVAILVATVGGVLAYDAWAWRRWTAPSDRPTVTVGVVQPNVSLEDKWDSFLTGVAQYRVLTRLSIEAAEQGAELIVWPETARPAIVYHDLERPDTYRMPDVTVLADELDVSMLIGSEYSRFRGSEQRPDEALDDEFYNAAFALHPDGTLDETWAAKEYLVPFVEKIPFEPLLGWWLEGREGDGWHWLSGNFEPGPSVRPLPFGHTEAGSVGVLVCYEQLFPDLARAHVRAGAGILAVVTNDAWWGRTVFQRYQRDVLRLRAIETRTSIVRAANTGISGLVDPAGRYLEESALFEEATLVGDLPVASDGRTWYVRLGDVVVWIALAAFAYGTLVSRTRAATSTRYDAAHPRGATAR